MATHCASCKASISFFSEYNVFFPQSNRKYCDRCSAPLMLAYTKMYDSHTKAGLTKAFQQLLTKIAEHALPDEGRSFIEEDCYHAYQQHLLSQYHEETSQSISELKATMHSECLQTAIPNGSASKQEISSMLTTTGYNFEGYHITSYLGVVTTGVAQGTGFLSELSADWNDFWGTASSTFEEKMRLSRETALNKLKLLAASKGANAILGIDFDISTLRNNMLAVMVTGTAVFIQETEISHKSTERND